MDVAGPLQAFSSANKILGKTYYDIKVISADGEAVKTDAGVVIVADLKFCDELVNSDFIIPGGPGVDTELNNKDILNYISQSVPNADRVISICSGSLLLAATGLLDGRVATSHWARSSTLAVMFPQVIWQLDRIFTQDDQFYCSAGITAGIDLAIALLEEDHGRALALDVAREMVVFMRRFGGQSQFSKPLNAQSTKHFKLGNLYAEIEENPGRDCRVHILANKAGMTERSLHRHFIRDLEMSPSQYVEMCRLNLARVYLEDGYQPIKQVAQLAGFATEQSLRRAFQKHLGVTPGAYRERFGIAKG